ncbi:MAG: hypothetical protein ACE5EF_07685 [Dehalococcoidia bacterium]
MSATPESRQSQSSTHQSIAVNRLRLNPRGRASGSAGERFELTGNPARDIIEAIVELAEARANWEECRGRLGNLLREHDELVGRTASENLPRPYAGRWILPEHDVIRDALTAPDLAPAVRKELPVAAATFAAGWYRRLAEYRSRRDIGGSRLAEAG